MPHLLIAIVDDELPVCRALQRLFTSSGFDAKTYESGSAFLNAMHDPAPDCVVLDLHMPGLTGLDVLERTAGDPRTPPIVVITGNDFTGTRNKVLEAGAAAYLTKPIEADLLLKTVMGAIEKRREGMRDPQPSVEKAIGQEEAQ